MKPKGLVLFSVLAILLISVLSASVASAQDAGPSPAMNVGSSDPGADPGTKQSSLFMAGQNSTKNTHQTLNPQSDQPRHKGTQNANNAAPTGADPSSSNASDPSSKGTSNPADPTSKGFGNPTDPGGVAGQIKELPKTGGARVPILSIVGVMLVAGGLLVRKALR